MSENNLLGDFLRAYRERITPSDVGITSLGRRRVAGLRREEVALLAGISADYYLRLEQGRDRHPSEQVVESLAHALLLDTAAAAHLQDLAARPRASLEEREQPVHIPTGIVQLLEAMNLPAFVQDRHFDVLESNAMARALSPTLRTGRNRMLSVFLDPEEQRLFVDWDEVAGHLVASFRASIAADVNDCRTKDLVSRLVAGHPRFHELWAHHVVVGRVDRPPVRLAHPVIGRLTLTRENLAIDGPDGLRLMIYHAEPGSDDLARLAELTD